jgi:glycosyltransferase involved in cell wall biosynthesis
MFKIISGVKNKTIIHFICYSPRIYSGFDRFNLLLACKLKEKGFESVLVFSDRIEVQSIIDDAEKEGIKIELISTKNSYSKVRDLLKIYFKYKPLIVHSHFDNFFQLTTALLSFFFSAKHFTSFHSMISSLNVREYKIEKGQLKFHMLRLYYRILIILSKKVLCVSDAVKNQFNEYSSSFSNNIQCLYLGVEIIPSDISKNILRSKQSLPIEKVLLCNVSAIECIKGIDILLEALNILKEKHHLKNFKCYHIGGIRSESNENREFSKILKKLVISLNLENEFIWLGLRNDVNEILSAFDIYIHPSRMEGIGVSIMEACAHSLPVVGSQVGGIPEIIKHNKNGFLFTTESSVELANYLNLLICNINLREKMARESLNLVKESFDIKKQAEKLKEIYLRH